ALHQRHRFLLVASVVMHLATAGLLHGKVDLVAKPLEEADNTFAGLRKKCVVVTGDEERNPHYNFPRLTFSSKKIGLLMLRHLYTVAGSSSSMRILLVVRLSAVVLVTLGTLILDTNGFCQSTPEKPVYLDPSQPLEKRVADLVSKMTLEEKVSQMQNH